MILEILASLKEVTIEGCIGLDSAKPVQPGEVVLGTLSGRALNLWAYMGLEWKGLVSKKADVLEARAVAMRSQAEADVDKANQKIGELNRLGLRLDMLNQFFRLELAEEYKVDLEWCVGVRTGFKAVKYNGPPADMGLTVLENVGGAV